MNKETLLQAAVIILAITNVLQSVNTNKLIDRIKKLEFAMGVVFEVIGIHGALNRVQNEVEECERS